MPISYILGGGIHQILAPDLTDLPCEQDRALISCGREHVESRVQFIREGHIRVQPNSRLVILGGCTLLNNEPFANKWCTRPIHLGNNSLFVNNDKVIAGALIFAKRYVHRCSFAFNQHAEGLVATTCCLAGEVAQAILRKGEAAAEKYFLAWLDIFDSDYYL